MGMTVESRWRVPGTQRAGLKLGGRGARESEGNEGRAREAGGDRGVVGGRSGQEARGATGGPAHGGAGSEAGWSREAGEEVGRRHLRGPGASGLEAPWPFAQRGPQATLREGGLIKGLRRWAPRAERLHAVGSCAGGQLGRAPRKSPLGASIVSVKEEAACCWRDVSSLRRKGETPRLPRRLCSRLGGGDRQVVAPSPAPPTLHCRCEPWHVTPSPRSLRLPPDPSPGSSAPGDLFSFPPPRPWGRHKVLSVPQSSQRVTAAGPLSCASASRPAPARPACQAPKSPEAPTVKPLAPRSRGGPAHVLPSQHPPQVGLAALSRGVASTPPPSRPHCGQPAKVQMISGPALLTIPGPGQALVSDMRHCSSTCTCPNTSGGPEEFVCGLIPSGWGHTPRREKAPGARCHWASVL